MIGTVTDEVLRKSYPKRHQWDRKGDHGKVLVIGGSRRYKGAPAMCGLSALRAGADLVTVAAPETSADIIASFSPNLITEPLMGDYISVDNVHTLEHLASKFDAVVIGNGLGRMVETKDAVHELLSYIRQPCVIDADALHLISEDKKLLRKGWVITPHASEFYNLSGHRVQKNVESRVKEVIRFSKEFKCTVLLKGYKDVIAEGQNVLVNSTGNPYMTVGGTGDVLSGICGAFLAMGMKSLSAAACAAYVCGEAGDMAAEDMGPGMLATDVLGRIPAVLKKKL
ncbi:MAG: NAD(P)H-hydrate dehydratase [Candidatus Aenigmatarchaeota archaeon]|nr:MAG: NAD(P)H-hydrate dehydratase [Candidatus Aenigmarchaeota archaeon]